MHRLDFVAPLQRRQVAKEMSEATTHDCGDRLVERRVGAKRRPVGADRFGRLVRHQGMRAFGLALKSESDRKCLDEREPEVDERSRRARFELELDLRGRRALLAGEQEPRVEGDLDRRAVRLDRPGRPADRGPSGFAPVVRDLSRDRTAEQGEVRLAGPRRDLRLLPFEGAPILRGRP